MSDQNLSSIVADYLYESPIVASSKEPIRVFCDMDGVVADFLEGVRRAYKLPDIASAKHLLDHTKNVWVDMAGEHPDIFSKLPLMPGARELMAQLVQKRDKGQIKLAMLSALPDEWYADPEMKKKGRDDKKAWVTRHFPQITADNVIVVRRRDKVKFAQKQQQIGHPAPVLIDDYPLNITEWHRDGHGVGILHMANKGVWPTIRELNQYLVAVQGE